MDEAARLRIDPAFKERQDRFSADLLREDELGMIVRAHLHIENELRAFIQLTARSPGRFKKLTYSKRIDVALEHGLLSELEKPLRAIGSLRNRFAHRLGTTVDQAESETISKALDILAEDIAESSYARTRQKLGAVEMPDRIDLLPPIERVAFYLFTIWAGVVAQTHRVQHQK